MFSILRLKQISTDLGKQHDLLRLIIEKMEIHTEADDMDEDVYDNSNPTFGQGIKGIGWSSPQLRHSLIKQASVINKWKGITNGKS